MPEQKDTWKVLHTADTHLGFKQYGFEERLKDYNNTVDYIYDRAKVIDVDIISVAGDIFEMPKPPASCVQCMSRNVHELLAVGVETIGIEGNHDAADEANAWLTTCGITPLDVGSPSIATYSKPGKPNLNIAGLNYYRTPALMVKLQELADYAAACKRPIDVLVLHCAVAEMAGFQVDLTAAQIAGIMKPTGCRAVLLGDIHESRQIIQDGILFIYPGSPEMTAADENDGKTFSVLDITPEKVKVTLHPIPNRNVVNVHIATEEDVDTILNELEKNKDSKPLYVVTFDKNIPDCRKRVTSLLKDKCIYRLIPTTMEDGKRVDILAQLSQQSHERKGALSNLNEIVVSGFGYDVGTDEHTIIMECMQTPDRVVELCKIYTRESGVKLPDNFNL